MPGPRTRGQEQGKLSNSRLKTGLNRVEPHKENALNTEANRPNRNLHPDQTLGSRFRALAAHDLTMDMGDQGIEVEA